MVLDLDPGEGAGIVDAAEIALVLHDMLQGVGLESVVKSTGSNGIHVYVPLNLPARFEQTKAFSRDRSGRVFVDWGQNDRHKSTVAAYSLRAKRARPTVSLPIAFADLAAAVDAGSTGALLPSPQDALDRVAAWPRRAISSRPSSTSPSGSGASRRVTTSGQR